MMDQKQAVQEQKENKLFLQKGTAYSSLEMLCLASGECTQNKEWMTIKKEND